MKKIIFRSAICVLLALSMVFCLASCGASMDKYGDRLEELEDDGEITGYTELSASSRNGYEETFENNYDIEVEIENMYYVNAGGIFSLSGYAYVIEFESTSQAKKFVKAYEEDTGIGTEGKLERVFEFIGGEFDGDLDELFEFGLACERDGKVVVCGNSDIVEMIVD